MLPEAAELTWQRLSPALQRPGFAVDITVWSTTPSQSAFNRAVTLSSTIIAEITSRYQLDAAQRARIRGVGQVWPFSDQKRPTVSITVHRREDNT